MKILVIGATGRVGGLLVDYALERGHEVTAFAPDLDSYPISHKNLTLFAGDVLFPSLVEAAVVEQDVVLSVIGLRQYRGPVTLLSKGMKHIVSAMKKKNVARVLTITGAGILQESEEYLIMESLSFPPNLQNLSLDHKRVYETLNESELAWTIVAPAFMHWGKRTGNYLLKPDYYPSPAKNEISVEDVADFIVSEMVENKFIQKRVGIAYHL